MPDVQLKSGIVKLLVDCGKSVYRVRAAGPEMLDFPRKGVEI